jgi:DNA-directed RNA polymerase subunit H (RpoH/RPB5)
MIYCLDTSAFIRLDRDYSREVFPSLWDDFIIGLVNEERLIATEEVKEELKRKDDELFKWVKEHCSKTFIKTDTIVMNRVKEIMERFPNLINPNNPTHNQADPFVIALALETGNVLSDIDRDSETMVITYEKYTGNLNGPRLPDICKYYNLKVGKLIDIFKAEGWRIGI